jgi:outer membrane autotransporter protein
MNLGGTFINEGSVTAPFQGIRLGTNSGSAGGTVENHVGAIITGGTNAVVIGGSAGGAGTLVNAGTITGGSADGVAFSFGGSVTNELGALIQVTNNSNAVSIVRANGTVINSGTIRNNGTGGFTTGLAIAGGTVTNNASGQIVGGFNGIWTNSVRATAIINEGLVEASRTQGGGSAIQVDAGGGSITNLAGGIIRSNTSNAALTDAGIQFTGAGSITNSGWIGSATGGLAIKFTSAATHGLTLNTGSVLNGNVQGGTGIDNLILTGSWAESISKFQAFETLSMEGTDWDITGNGTFTTSSAVQSGLLQVSGQLTSPTVTVGSLGTLGGNGTIIGALTNNGALAPGASIGQLNVTGSAGFGNGSFFDVEVMPDGTGDKLAVTGAALVDGTIRVSAGQGVYTLGTVFNIVSATGGVTGLFDGVTVNSAFLAPEVTYDPNNVYLTLVGNTVSFDDVADTFNQNAVAQSLQDMAAGDPLFDAVMPLSADEARSAFDQLSGEAHASLLTLLIDESRPVREAMGRRLRQSGGSAETPTGLNNVDERPLAVAGAGMAGGAKLWMEALGRSAEISGDGNAAALDATTAGLLFGVDAMLGDGLRLGLASGFQNTSFDVDARGTSGDVESYHLAAYGGMRHGAFDFRAGGAYTLGGVETTRRIVFPNFTDQVEADYDAETGQVFGEIGYLIPLGDASIEPFGNLTYIKVDREAYDETGGPSALEVAATEESALLSTLGVNFSAAMATSGDTTIRATGRLGWQHAFDAAAPEQGLAFASGLGSPFTVRGLALDQDSLIVEAGLQAQLSAQAALSLSYSGQLSDESQSHAATAQLVVNF